MTILGLAASFKTMNQPGPTWPIPTVTLFDGLLLEKHMRWGRGILTQSSLMSLIYAIQIWNQYL